MRIKKYAIWGLALFACFYLFTRPANAADAVNGVVAGILHGGNQLATFFTHIAL